jgi:hypothetical protein
MLTIKLYTEEELEGLRRRPKRVTNPGARWLKKPRDRPVHRQRTFKASSEQDENLRFEVYQRQNIQDGQDFSCGIAYLPPGGSRLTLARYNSPGHEHGDISYRSHIHHATEKAIALGKKPEYYAEETSRYETPNGALACLIEDFNLTEIVAPRDRLRLL